MANLASKAVIVNVEVAATTMKVTDKLASEELTDRKNAQSKAAKVVKNLVNPSNLKAIIAVQSAFRAYLMKQTVPWMGGTVLLPKASLFDFTSKVNEFKRELLKEVEVFLDRYQNLITEARSELGDLFDERSYPDPDELRGKFSIDVNILPVPDFNKFTELGLDQSMTDLLKQEALESENKLMRDATMALYQRVRTRVEMLANRFKDPETKKYRESLVEGLEVLVYTLPDLNVAGDTNLQMILDDITAMLGTFTMEEAKKSEDIRKNVASQCDAILDKLSTIF
jgi:hypothetical protein